MFVKTYFLYKSNISTSTSQKFGQNFPIHLNEFDWYCMYSISHHI